MNSILTLTREVYSCCVAPDGTLYDVPVGNIKRRNLEKRQIDFMKSYINFIMNSKFVSDTTKIYIRSSANSVAAVFRTYNLCVEEKERVNIKTAQAKIDYDKNKLHKYFPDDMLAKLIYYNNSTEIGDYEKRLNLVMSQYTGGSKLLGNLMLKLPKAAIQDKLSEDEFMDFIKIIAPYSRRQVKFIEGNLPERAVGYTNYLLSATHLEGTDLINAKILKELLE